MDSGGSGAVSWENRSSVVNHGTHRYSWVELDREKFEKEQTECIAKAIKQEECAAKEKHVRRTIIGTWQERGSSMFWTVLGKMPLPSQAIMCWKAMMVLHKILREGHANVVKDSFAYRKTLQDLYSTYRFATATYGKLCSHYLKVLEFKLRFHHRYPGIPGSLMFNDEAPIKIPSKDINDVFTFAVQVLDFQDLLLTLEEEIFNTLQRGKNNSQIHASQCRIAVLVPVLKECGGLYDILVHIMFKLHRSLPPDTLDGHRTRFYGQFTRIRTFFSEASNLTFVTTLTSVPTLPHSPPNFLIHGRVDSKPTVVEKPKEIPVEPEPLIPKKDDRDLLIEQLMREINELREQFEAVERMAKETENALRMQIMRLTEELEQYKKIAEEACAENAVLQSQLDQYKVEEEEKEKHKTNDEKFNKLKALYAALRNEHVQLLRANAEVKKSKEAIESEKSELQKKIVNLEESYKGKEDELMALKQQAIELEEANKFARDNLIKAEDEKNTELSDAIQRLESANENLSRKEIENKELQSSLEKLRQDADNQLKALQKQVEEITSVKVDQESARKSAEDDANKLKSERDDLEKNLTSELAAAREKHQSEEEERKRIQNTLDELHESSKKQIAFLNESLEKIQREKEEEERLKQISEKKITDLIAENMEKIKKLEEAAKKEEKELQYKILCTAAEECEQFIRSTLEEFENPLHTSGSTCTAEYLKSRLDELCPLIDSSSASFKDYSNGNGDLMVVIREMSSVAHQISEAMLHGKATSHMSSPEDAKSLVSHSISVGNSSLEYFSEYKTRPPDMASFATHDEKLKQSIATLAEFAKDLIPKEADQLEGVETMVDEEINATAQLVADAAARIEEMLMKARKEHSGIQLEVSERILDSCTDLMKAIRELILRSKDLQDEIVLEGRGTASAKEFYKRHHKWTEGLISAAKSVGWGASVLVDAADKVIQGKGKFEELVVASNEIAASTAQLVAASRVKASRDSEKLAKVMSASKGVGNATATVVASVKAGAELAEEAKTNIDYSKLTLTQAKRLQMDSQVRMLELESSLDKERTKLGKLRAAHYQLAAELYGLEEDEKKGS